MRNLRTLLQQVGATAVAIAWLGTGAAQEPYPNQQIKIVVPFPAGGGTDITARLPGEQLRKTLGQSVVMGDG